MRFHRRDANLLAVLRALGAVMALMGAMVAGQATGAWAEQSPPSPTPKPIYGSPNEAQLRAGLTAHLQPLLQLRLDDTQLSAAKAALAAIRAGKFDVAAAERSKIKDLATSKIIEWQRLMRAGPRPATEYLEFLTQNPNWPDGERIQQLYERALLADGGSAKQIVAYFSKQEPVSGAGYAALASAELALGHKEAAAARAARSWCYERFLESNEDDFLARFGSLLREADHKCRLDRLLISSTSNAVIRRSRLNAAERLVPRLSPPEQKKAIARIKVYGGKRLEGTDAGGARSSTR